MRLIGHLADEKSARAFADYLYVQGIENQLEQDNKDGWGIWISDEDKITRASDLLTAFRQNPTDPKYAKEGKGAAELRAQEEKDQHSYRKKLRNRRHLFRPLTPYGFGPLTFGMIAVSVVVFFLSHFGQNDDAIRGLFITDFSTGRWDTTLPEIRQGEIWRLITPIFIHFSPLHIIFNMLWLRDLGSMIEARQSSLHLFILTVAFAICSNVGEVYIGHTPNFGGMSGVVYGLLGYVWIRGKFDPGSGLYLHSYTVVMMIAWFIVCYTKIFGDIANTAHAVGLGMGMAWGFLSSLPHRKG
jgi:GlpG protein